MKAFSEYNPIVVFVYILAVAGIAMFCVNPIILALSLLGAAAFFVLRNGAAGMKTHLLSLGLLALMTVINPLFNHNGVSVLFILGDNPVTLEALLYGLCAAVMVVAVLYWFRSFSQLMTGDKLLYVFGRVSPKLSLLLSMTLRYIPLFTRQAAKVNRSQRALGLYKDDNIIDNIKGGMRVFSVMVGWALENGIVTADSMTARGYGIGRRTQFSLYRFRSADVALLAVTALAIAATLLGMGSGGLSFAFYPSISPPPLTATGLAGYIAYGLLALLPAICEGEERLRWKYLRSKI